MEELYLAYLAQLDELSGLLKQLADLARRKTQAVRADDLMALDDILKQEQAKSMVLRGMEQKRMKLLAQMGMEQIPLRDLVDSYPPNLQLRAKQSSDQLRTQYTLYTAAAEVARNTLECNLHEIEKIIQDLGVDNGGAGYNSPEVQPPKSMKTDFRA